MKNIEFSMPVFRRSMGAFIACIVAVFMAVSLNTPIAAAHDELIESTPAADETLEEAPENIALKYSAMLQDIGYAVIIVDAEGFEYPGESILDGDTVTYTPEIQLPQDSWYEVRWRVVSSDGHPIDGVIAFAVGEVGEKPEFPAETSPLPDNQETADDTRQSPAETEDESEISDDASVETPEESGQEQQAENTEEADASEADDTAVDISAPEDDSNSNLLWYIIGGLVIGAIIFFVLLARKSKDNQERDADPEDG